MWRWLSMPWASQWSWEYFYLGQSSQWCSASLPYTTLLSCLLCFLNNEAADVSLYIFLIFGSRSASSTFTPSLWPWQCLSIPLPLPLPPLSVFYAIPSRLTLASISLCLSTLTTNFTMISLILRCGLKTMTAFGKPWLVVHLPQSQGLSLNETTEQMDILIHPSFNLSI